MVWNMAADIVRDYTAHKLQLAGYNNWRIIPQEHPTEPMRTMRLLGQQFEAAYDNKFDDMTQNIGVTEPEAREAFQSISHVLFEEGIRWGRIVGLIVLAAKLSVKAMRFDLPNQVDNFVEWTITSLQTGTIAQWITQHGGWDGFVDFYRRPENQNNHQNGEFSFLKSLSIGIATIAGVAGAVGAIGVFLQKS